METVSDLFLYKPPESPSSRIYTIRPYLPSDEKAVYDVCSKTMTDGEQIVESSKDHVQLIGDRLVELNLNNLIFHKLDTLDPT